MDFSVQFGDQSDIVYYLWFSNTKMMNGWEQSNFRDRHLSNSFPYDVADPDINVTARMSYSTTTPQSFFFNTKIYPQQEDSSVECQPPACRQFVIRSEQVWINSISRR